MEREELLKLRRPDGWMSREFEANLPEFQTQQEAYDFFNDLFGASFDLQYIEETFWSCAIVHEPEAYVKGAKELIGNGFTSGLAFMFSHQPVQIMNDGSIHMVY